MRISRAAPPFRSREVRASAWRAGFVKSCEGGFG
jgi:hypothetical protein